MANIYQVCFHNNQLYSYKYMSEQKLQPKVLENKQKYDEQSDSSDSSSSVKQKKPQKNQQKVRQSSTQRNSSQRSRSRKKRRSRSKETKKKHKNSHKSSHRRSSDSERSSSHKRKRSKDRKKKQHDRGRERDRYRSRPHRDFRDYKDHRDHRDRNNNIQNVTSSSMPPTNDILAAMIDGQRRKRQRSRSPLDYYRRNQNNNDGQFWDAFSWVPRINYTPNVSTSALANTKKMRRLMITKIPYEIGITQDNLRDLITRFMAQNYLKDQMNNCPVVNLQMNEADHNVAVQLSSVQETCRICRMEKIQLFKGFSNGIIRLGDSIYGNSVLTQAQTAGQAQAAAFAAINVLQNKKTNFTIDSSPTSTSSTVLRITNAVTSYMATHLTKQQWEDYKQDLLEGFSQYGKVVYSWFVTEEEKNICADAGNLFIEYEYKQNAQAAMSEMQGRLYDQRNIKLFYWPRDLFYSNYRPGVTPPVLPPPLKTTKQQAK